MTSDFVVVCVAEHNIATSFDSDLKKIFSDNRVTLLSQEKRPQGTNYVINLGDSTFNLFNSSLIDLSRLHRIDIGLIPKHIFKAQKKLVIFDMDSTLITSEVIDEMALRHGVGEQVKTITKRAMNGELIFDQSLTERVALLKGFHRRHMEEILNELSYTPGTPEFLTSLKKLGVKTAIASGGFQYFARSLQQKLQMDYVFANDLEFENDILTGKISGSIVNAEAKAQILTELATKEGFSLDQVVAIGDGANDIPMLLKAGLGIAIHAKEKVQLNARYRINFGPMTHALSFMNYDTL